jgi:hypothetical protein
VAESRHAHLPLAHRFGAHAFDGWGDGGAWRLWLVALVPDTFKEVWSWTVTALLLCFLVSLIDSIAQARWHQLQEERGRNLL